MVASDLISMMIRDAFGNEELADCEVHVEDRIFKVNTMILKMHSDVFRAYFRHNSVEKQTGIIKIGDTTPQLVELMLCFMYTGQVENLETEAYSLFVLADRYNVVELKKLCALNMCDNLQLDTIFNCLNVAYRLNADELKQKCIQYAADNENEVQDRPEWIQMTDSEPRITRDLCRLLSERLRQRQQDAHVVPEAFVQVEPRNGLQGDLDLWREQLRQMNERLREQVRQMNEQVNGARQHLNPPMAPMIYPVAPPPPIFPDILQLPPMNDWNLQPVPVIDLEPDFGPFPQFDDFFMEPAPRLQPQANRNRPNPPNRPANGLQVNVEPPQNDRRQARRGREMRIEVQNGLEEARIARERALEAARNEVAANEARMRNVARNVEQARINANRVHQRERAEAVERRVLRPRRRQNFRDA